MESFLSAVGTGVAIFWVVLTLVLGILVEALVLWGAFLVWANRSPDGPGVTYSDE